MNLLDIDISEYKTLFLDRDGVINQLRPNDYVKCWEEFKFLPGIFEALAMWSSHFKYIFIVTNQRGVGKGLMSEESLKYIHNKMLTEIVNHGGRIDKIYYCIDIEDSSHNRKPNIGMAYQAKRDFPDIVFSEAIMIGDSNSDKKFAFNAGMDFYLIK